MTALERMLVLCLVVSTVAFAGDPASVAESVRSWRASRETEIVAELVELLSIPNLASDAAAVERNVRAIASMLERRGVSVRVLRIEGAPPIVVGDLRAPGATRTIAFYAHYDGQPVDESRWTHAPWDPVMRDRSGAIVDWRGAPSIDPEARIHARSAGDDKAPIVAMVAALDALRASRVRPAVGLRFVFEGEEEAGSPHLGAYLARYPDALRPDAWILCDGPVHQSRRAELFFGARGVVDFDLTVYGPSKALHDGHYGNWAPNPIAMLARLVASMREDDGTVLVEGFYDGVPPQTEAERQALARIPDVEAHLRQELGLGRTEGNGRGLNDLLMLPALNVRGIESGHVGARASNTIQTEARASFDVRLVPPQTPESVEPLIERHIRSQGYAIVRETPDAATRMAHPKLAKLVWGSGYPSARTPLDLPLSREVASLMTAAGREPILLPTVGGSIPMHLFQQPNGTPVIGLPIANHDDDQHAPDENLRLQNLWDGIDVFATLFAGLRPSSSEPPVAPGEDRRAPPAAP